LSRSSPRVLRLARALRSSSRDAGPAAPAPRCWSGGALLAEDARAGDVVAELVFGLDAVGEGPFADPSRGPSAKPSRRRAQARSWSGRAGVFRPLTAHLDARTRALLGGSCRRRGRTVERRVGPLAVPTRSCAHALRRGASAPKHGTCGSRPLSRGRLTSGDHTAVATPTCPVARSRSRGLRFLFPDEGRSPLRALSGASTQLAGRTREREWAEQRVPVGSPTGLACGAGLLVVSSVSSRGENAGRR
jgi:hypothetical protein